MLLELLHSDIDLVLGELTLIGSLDADNSVQSCCIDAITADIWEVDETRGMLLDVSICAKVSRREGAKAPDDCGRIEGARASKFNETHKSWRSVQQHPANDDLCG